MTYPDTSTRHLEDAQAKLKRDLASLTDSFYDLDRKHDTTAGELEEATRNFASLSERVEQAETSTRRQQSKLDTTTALLNRTVQRLEHIERAVRVAGGVPVVDLDDVPPATRALAHTASTRHALTRQLLPEWKRTQLTTDMRQHPAAKRELAAIEDTLLEIVTTLLGTERGSAGRTDAAARLDTATATRDDLIHTRIPEAKITSAAARTVLQADNTKGVTVRPQLERAEAARTDLETKLRTSITTAIGSSALLPTWFANTFGVAPPRRPAEGDRWLRIATDVLAYRVTYDIDDPATALSAVEEGWDYDRQNWYSTLQRDIDILNPGT